ncbi:MAG: FHA domain-containing protein [Gemmatimonadales bacterium]
MRAQFTFLSGARAGHVETFRKAYIGLGRHPLSDVRCDADRDLDVSSRHAAIVHKDDGFYLQDLGSRNGTFRNGRQIAAEVRLADGDVIGFGRHGPTVAFHTLPGDDESDTAGAEALARPRRSSTALRIALEVAHQTRHLRRTTKILIAALIAVAALFVWGQWSDGRERHRELSRLQARADSLGREAQALAARFEGEMRVLREAGETLGLSRETVVKYLRRFW